MLPTLITAQTVTIAAPLEFIENSVICGSNSPESGCLFKWREPAAPSVPGLIEGSIAGPDQSNKVLFARREAAATSVFF